MVVAVVRHNDNVLAAAVRHDHSMSTMVFRHDCTRASSGTPCVPQSSTPTYPQLHAFRICACQSESSPMTQQLWMARWGSSSLTMPCNAKTEHKQS